MIVGGGLGRTPMVGMVVRDFLPVEDLLPYVEAVLSVYNVLGRRDNKYKARIKITLHETGREEITRMVEERFAELKPLFGGNDQKLLADIRAAFAPPVFRTAPVDAYDAFYKADRCSGLGRTPIWPPTATPITPSSPSRSKPMAKLRAMRPAIRCGFWPIWPKPMATVICASAMSKTLILPHVHKSDLPAVHAALQKAGLGTANVGLISDIIACPGMDYCALATARSIPVAQEIAIRFNELEAGA